MPATTLHIGAIRTAFGYVSALSYIPEGAWNDPGSAGAYTVGATGGGVSSVVATPSWQTGTGVPSARAGRYTPDVSFTASADHDGYLVCMAAIGGDCGNGFIEIFGGTSASAPDMAGVAALLDQSMGSAQGNITPNIYALAASYPGSFHDVTVTSSGVASCSVTTPSMCNNSIPGNTTLTGGTQGFLVQTGYDEATGWGSLDITNFIQDYAALTSGPASQTITFAALPSLTYGETGVTLSATASSGLPVSFASMTPSICTVSGTTLNLVGALSNCTIQATQAGDSSYAAATPVTQMSYVKRATQSITFATPPTQTYGAVLSLSATASSGLAVSFASTTPSVCTVSGSPGPTVSVGYPQPVSFATGTGPTVSMVSAGTCTIQASQAGNSDYLAAATVSRSFKVTQASQTITFPALPALTYGETGVTLSATASSGLTVTFASTTPSICTVSGTTLTIVGAQNNCTIQATQAGNSNYLAAPAVSQMSYVKRATQSITFAMIPTQPYGEALALSATASSGLAVSYASTTTSICTVSGSTATMIALGTCTIQASQAGNTDYLAAGTVSRSFKVAQAAQTITFTALPTLTYGETGVTLNATASSGLAVTLTSTTPSICTVSGTTLTIVGGQSNCTIKATQAGNADYLAAPAVSQSSYVNRKGQSITFPTIPTTHLSAGTVSLSATASSGLTVSFASTTTGVCTVSGTTATLVSAGTCTIQATQAGNSDYLAAGTVNKSFTVTAN